MNGYLLTLTGSMDDMPVGLFKTRKEAVEFAKKFPAGPVDEVPDRDTPAPLLQARRVFGRGPSRSEKYGYQLTGFMYGRPVDNEVWFDENGNPNIPGE